jgi:23S rRNA (cytidine1920-2'-O)/16S rRNA (cytidine1409-2'-O)-methyltransferase
MRLLPNSLQANTLLMAEPLHREQKMRLDQLLAEKGLAPSRARAADLVRRGAVRVNGEVAAKPGRIVSLDAAIAVAPGSGVQYVSRAALKLLAALDVFDLSPEGRAVLDVGASTGGFTETLLERGACRVYAVDVGSGQLHERLRRDPRVINLENTDARALNADLVPEAVAAIVVDVSFISLLKAVPQALRFAGPGAWLAALVKPQFEVGRAALGKGGLVKDEAARRRALEDVRGFLAAQPGWTVLGTIPSPVKGQDGNQEYLIGARYEA